MREICDHTECVFCFSRSVGETFILRKVEREKEREREKRRDRTDRLTDRQIDKQTERQTVRQKKRKERRASEKKRTWISKAHRVNFFQRKVIGCVSSESSKPRESLDREIQSLTFVNSHRETKPT